ncbi:MAG: TRAM domain-containing protein [Capsulimonadales bacterium]|nr:TRAM domain-containing protein [Capsulimonadales bacterium]
MDSKRLPSEEPEGETVRAEIRGLAVGGTAVGRVTGPEGSPRVGMTIFLPFVAPGEVVEARVRRVHARYLDAELSAIRTPSGDRTTPPCPYFGACGGCDLQHMTYEAQLAAKHDMVRGAFRSGGLAEAADRIEAVVPGPPFGYRRRIILHIDGEGRAGYYRRQSHTVLPVVDCPISGPEIRKFLAAGIEFGETAFSENAELHIETGENGLFAVLKTTGHLTERQAGRLLERLRPLVTGALIEAEGRGMAQFGEAAMLRKMAGMAEDEAGEAAPGVFSQVNPVINEQLVERVVGLAERTGAQSACDLYAGAGNFALPLAAGGRRVTAVERVSALVTAGRAEATRRGLAERLEFVRSDVAHYLRRKPRPTDLIVADPPRAGLGKLTGDLGFAPRMAFISCHLPSAVRDLKALEAEGWHVETVTPFDMFAQTAHVELLTVLYR